MATIEGSGNVVSEQRAVSEFERVAAGGIGTLVLAQGATPSLTVEAEDNILPYLATEVHGDTLEIGVRTSRSEGIAPTRPIRYLLTTPKVSGVALSGTTSLDAAPLRAEAFTLDLSGTGGAALAHLEATELHVAISGAPGVTIAGQVARQAVEISGAGRYEARGLVSNDVTIHVSGAGIATVTANNSLTAQVSGTGTIRYAGHPTVTQRISGVGSVQPLG